jgi:hypothetical protein
MAASFDNFSSLQKKMESLPSDQLQKYINGQGAYPQEEQMAALFAQAKHAGLELGEQAKQGAPSGTIAENINHKAVLSQLQEIAQKSGMQITGVAPINAGLGAIPQPMAPPQGQQPMPQPAPQPAPQLAPQPAPQPVPQPAPQPAPQAPTNMAHGGITHVVPHHMFKFSHGGGIMGFDGTDGSDVNAATAAVNQAMPEEMPEHTSLTPMQYDQQRAAALQAVKDNFTPAPKRQETYAERDARMHEAPSLSSYKDPFSLANISAAINNSGYKPLSSNAPNVVSPVDVEPTIPAPADYVRHNMANDPRLNVSNNTVVSPPSHPVVSPSTKPPAGLGALNAQAPVKPVTQNKVDPATKIPGTENSLNYMAMEDKQLTEKSDILDEIKKQELVQAHYGLNSPYGIEAEKRASQLADMYKKINEEHPYERLLQVLTGIGTGGLGGAAPAYLRSEGAYRDAQQAQFDNINKILSPIEAARREEARTNSTNVISAYNQKEADRKKALAEMAKTQLTGNQEIQKQGLTGTQAMDRAKLETDTQLKVAAIQKAVALANKDATAEQIAAELAKDPAFAGKSYAERMTAAYSIKQGARPQTAKEASIEKMAKDWGGFDIMTKKNWANQGINTFDDYLSYMQEKMSGKASTTPASLTMPSADKLTAYAAAHFGGDIEKAKNFLASQGYK